ncbi:sulfatase-like hydrolase/transferase, partial [Rhodopirellula sp.]|nr:sulfatase-like hydrolase/transferase [Rhodopirellula sp.]
MSFCFLLAFGTPVRGEGNQPNILFVFSDDHAPQAIGAYGSKINETPNLDRIAREGAIFQNSFCA